MIIALSKKRREGITIMKNVAVMISLILTVTLAAVPSYAQRGMRGKGGGGWGMGSPYSRMYDPATVETISGKVERIDAVTPMKGMSVGVHLRITTDKGPVSVHLGPQWYLQNQDVLIKTGDQVEITGSRVVFEGKPAVIAKEVIKGDEVLKLRDDNGYPAWSGWRRR